jgi:hypothetical protein
MITLSSKRKYLLANLFQQMPWISPTPSAPARPRRTRVEDLHLLERRLLAEGGRVRGIQSRRRRVTAGQRKEKSRKYERRGKISTCLEKVHRQACRGRCSGRAPSARVAGGSRHRRQSQAQGRQAQVVMVCVEDWRGISWTAARLLEEALGAVLSRQRGCAAAGGNQGRSAAGGIGGGRRWGNRICLAAQSLEEGGWGARSSPGEGSGEALVAGEEE